MAPPCPFLTNPSLGRRHVFVSRVCYPIERVILRIQLRKSVDRSRRPAGIVKSPAGSGDPTGALRSTENMLPLSSL